MVPDGRTDGQTDGRTDDAKTISLRLRRGIIKVGTTLVIDFSDAQGQLTE